MATRSSRGPGGTGTPYNALISPGSSGLVTAGRNSASPEGGRRIEMVFAAQGNDHLIDQRVAQAFDLDPVAGLVVAESIRAQDARLASPRRRPQADDGVGAVGLGGRAIGGQHRD